MKKLNLKAMAFVLPALLYAKDTIQVEIRDGNQWQLIGVNGIHEQSATSSASTWGAIISSGGAIMDEVDSDGNTTWYNFTANGSAGNAVITTDDNASLGVLIIGGEILPNGNAASAVAPDRVYIKGSFKVFDPTSPKSTMYIKSKSTTNPVAKITYQSNMEGTDIFIKFDNVDDANFYTNIKLDSSKTYDNALVIDGLENNSSSASSTLAVSEINITNAYDENLSDNDRSTFPGDNFNTTTSLTSKYADTNITIFKYDTTEGSGSWKLYDSRNSASQNDFDSFVAGNGYWVKVEKSSSEPSGFIFATGDISDSTWNSVYGDLINGWNLLSFNDEILRYSPNGIFISLTDLNSNSGLRITDAYGSDSFDLIAEACDTEKNASAYINFQVVRSDQDGKSNFSLRAYPAQSYDGTTSGIVIIGSHRFEVNASNAKSLAGADLKIDPTNNQYYPQYGEYMLGVVPNEAIYGLDSNGVPIYAKIQGFSSNTVNDSEVDLSTVTNIVDVATKINQSLQNIKDKNATAYLIDTDWDDKNETILMVVDKKFGIQESSYYKLFKQVDYGTKVYVEGNTTGTLAPLVDVNATFSQTVTGIYNAYNVNGVKAYATNSADKVMILISKNRAVDIKENGAKNVLTDLKIDYNDGNDTKKGAFTIVYDASDLYNISVNYDNNDTYDTSRNIGQKVSTYKITNLTDNLSHQTYWTRDFPSDLGAIQKMAQLSNKRVKAIYTAAKTPNGMRWVSLDATKSPATWFDSNDTQTLLWTEKERGYWVLLDDYTAPTISHTVNSATPTVTTHFDNNVSTIGGVSTTYNYIRKDVSVNVSGIDSRYVDSEYTYASISGISYPLINNGGTRILSIDSYAMAISQSTSDKSVDLFTYDGLGGKGSTSSVINVGIVQPSAPQIAWDTTTGELTIANTDFAQWQIHEGNISDINPANSKKVTPTATNYNLADLGLDPDWTNTSFNGSSSDGTYFKMKVVTVGDNGFYSNIQAFTYAPVHEKTHVLSTDSTIDYDQTPGSYFPAAQEGILIDDSGVGLRAAIQGNMVTIAYKPITNTDNYYVRLNNTLPKVMFVEANSSYPIATIKFVDEYNGKRFYIYDAASKSLFVGKFDDAYNNDTNRYTLIKVDNYGNDGQPIVKP